MSPAAQELNQTIAEKKKALTDARKALLAPLEQELKDAKTQKRQHTTKAATDTVANVGLGAAGGLWGGVTGFFRGMGDGAVLASKKTFRTVIGTPIQSVIANDRKIKERGAGLFTRDTKANGKKKKIPGFMSMFAEFWRTKSDLKSAQESALSEAQATLSEAQANFSKTQTAEAKEKLLKAETNYNEEEAKAAKTKKRGDHVTKAVEILVQRSPEAQQLASLQKQSAVYARETAKLRKTPKRNRDAKDEKIIAYGEQEMRRINDEVAQLHKQLVQVKKDKKVVIQEEIARRNEVYKMGKATTRELNRVTNRQYRSQGWARATNTFKNIGSGAANIVHLFRAAAAPIVAVPAGALGAVSGAVVHTVKGAKTGAQQGYNSRQAKNAPAQQEQPSMPILALPERAMVADQRNVPNTKLDL